VDVLRWKGGRLLFALAGLAAVAGCTALFGSPLPDPYVPEHLAPVSSGTAPISTIARTLDRPRHLVIDLASALELAAGRSPVVELARVREREAENVLFAQRFSFLPGITPLFRAFSHKGQAQPQAATNVNVTRTNFFIQPVIAARWWPGPVVFDTLAASRREDASQAATETAKQDVRLASAWGYFELVRTHALVAIAQEAVAEADEHLRHEERLFEKGAGIRAHVLRATAELADRQQDLAVAEGKVAIASARLASVLQLDPDVALVPRELFPSPMPLVPDDAQVTDLIRRAFEDRPELHEAHAELEAREHDRDGVLYGPLSPFVTPLIQTGLFGPTLGDLHFSQDAMVLVGWNIGPGGLFDVPRIREASFRMQQQHLEIDVIRARVQREVSEARARVVAAEDSLVAARKGVESAGEYLRLTKDRLAKGAAIQLEVLDGERVYARAQGRQVEAIVDYNDAQWELLRATGGVAPP
jgi:outer membrane protein TolC